MSIPTSALTLYSESDYTRHLSERDQVSLARAVNETNEELWEDRVGIQPRREALQKLLNRISKRAIDNKDNKGILKDWEDEIRWIFYDSGETDFAFEYLADYLEEILKQVVNGHRMTQRARGKGFILAPSFVPRVPVPEIGVVGTSDPASLCATGFEIQRAHIKQLITRLDEQLSKHDPEINHTFRTELDLYHDRLETILTDLVTPLNLKVQARVWEERYRTIRTLEHLVFHQTSVLPGGFTTSPLFDIENIVARCNVWTPPRPSWFDPDPAFTKPLVSRKNPHQVVKRNEEKESKPFVEK